jgi:hypothetical protein
LYISGGRWNHYLPQAGRWSGGVGKEDVGYDKRTKRNKKTSGEKPAMTAGSDDISQIDGKERLKLVAMIVVTIAVFGLLLVPFHEGMHMVFNELQPGTETLVVHLFDKEVLETGHFGSVDSIISRPRIIPLIVEESIINLISMLIISLIVTLLILRRYKLEVKK